MRCPGPARGDLCLLPREDVPNGDVAGTRRTCGWGVVLPLGHSQLPSSTLQPAGKCRRVAKSIKSCCPGELDAAEPALLPTHPTEPTTELRMTSPILRCHVTGGKLPACAVQDQVQRACTPGSMEPGVQIPAQQLTSGVIWGKVLNFSVPPFLYVKWGIITGSHHRAAVRVK